MTVVDDSLLDQDLFSECTMKSTAGEDINRKIYVVTFFIDGEIVHLSAYRNLENAHRDREVWVTGPLIRQQFSNKYESMSPNEIAHDVAVMASKQQTFRDTDVYGADIRESAQWPAPQDLDAPLDAAVLSWLRDHNAWCYTNVLASLFGVSLTHMAKCVVGLASVGSVQLGSSFNAADGQIIYEVSASPD